MRQSYPSFMMRFQIKNLQLYSNWGSQVLNRYKLVQQWMALALGGVCSSVIVILQCVNKENNHMVGCHNQFNKYMTTYGEGYYKVMQRISKQFIGLHNLNVLSHLERKTQCYTQFHSQPHQYYECFFQVEDKRAADANELGGAYNLIEEEFKLCNQGCKNVGSEGSACVNTCTDKFTNSVQSLYEAFYKTRVGNRKQYKKARS